jgi:hypothetical protein
MCFMPSLNDMWNGPGLSLGEMCHGPSVCLCDMWHGLSLSLDVTLPNPWPNLGVA